MMTLKTTEHTQCYRMELKHWWKRAVVNEMWSLTNGVGGGHDSAASLQRGDDAGFGDGDALLLHGFMDTRPVCIIHLQRGTKKSYYETLRFSNRR